eukprot:89874-Prorocentrum_minimum.AAC.1
MAACALPRYWGWGRNPLSETPAAATEGPPAVPPTRAGKGLGNQMGSLALAAAVGVAMDRATYLNWEFSDAFVNTMFDLYPEKILH